MARKPDQDFPDGSRIRNGVKISAADAANTDRTLATAAARDAEQAARLSGTPPLSSLPPPAPVAGISGAPTGYPPGYNPARGGIDVNGYVGSMYDPDFARNNPGTLRAPDTAETFAAKQQLLDAANKVPGRHYSPANLAQATPAQLLGEAAVLPGRLENQAISGALPAAPLGGAPAGLLPPSVQAPAFGGGLASLPSLSAVPPAAAAPIVPAPAAPNVALDYLRSGGRDMKTATALQGITKPADRVGQVRDIEGVKYVFTQDGNLAPLKPGEGETMKAVTVGGRQLFVGPGNKYFDDKGQPVDFGSERPMSATDWIISGQNADDYPAYRDKFSRATGEAGKNGAAAAKPAEGAATTIKTKEEFDKLPKGAKFIFNGQAGTKK